MGPVLSYQQSKKELTEQNGRDYSTVPPDARLYQFAPVKVVTSLREVIDTQRSAIESHQYERAWRLAADSFHGYPASTYSSEIQGQFPELFNGIKTVYLPAEMDANETNAVQPVEVNSRDQNRSVFTYILVRQPDGWRVDGIQQGNCYIPGPCGNPFEVGYILQGSPQSMGFRFN